MKKLLSITMLLAMLLTFSACGSDEDNVLNSEPAVPSNPFIGKWTYKLSSIERMEVGYVEITEDNKIFFDKIYYSGQTIVGTNAGTATREFTYTIEKNSDGEDIICYGRGSWHCEGRLFRNLLIFDEVRIDSETGEETRKPAYVMTRDEGE